MDFDHVQGVYADHRQVPLVVFVTLAPLDSLCEGIYNSHMVPKVAAAFRFMDFNDKK